MALHKVNQPAGNVTQECAEATNSRAARRVGEFEQVLRAAFTSDGLGLHAQTDMESC